MNNLEISFDASRLDLRATSELIQASYWGEGRSAAFDARAFANSLCAGAYLDGKQIGFGRVVTDYAYFAYLCDVMVWPEYKGRGVGTRLIRALLDHPELETVVGWSLRTKDAHGLYAKFGFASSTDGDYMRWRRAAPE